MRQISLLRTIKKESDSDQTLNKQDFSTLLALFTCFHVLTQSAFGPDTIECKIELIYFWRVYFLFHFGLLSCRASSKGALFFCFKPKEETYWSFWAGSDVTVT